MIGINFFGLIKNISNDFPGTIKSIKEAGFDQVELLLVLKKRQGLFPLALTSIGSLQKVMDELHKNGLTAHSAHVFASLTPFSSARSTAEKLKKIRKEYGIDTFVFSGMFKDAKGAEKWAKYLSAIAAEVKDDGCKILCHNHSQEFEMITVDGKEITAFDYFFSIADSSIGMQLDIGWAGICFDEVEIAKKYADRIVSLHLKDFIPETRNRFTNENMPKERFCAIGSGEIKTAEIIAMRDSFPNFGGDIIIDQDHGADVIADMNTGFKNIQAML